jgi:broad specificity phosphatase PhoE
MKKIYFVRHGESEGNAGPIRQSAETPLTETGRRQAEFIAKRCAKLPIEAVISSTMVRARETSARISKELFLPVEHSDLFMERRKASIVVGKPKDDPETIAIEKVQKENFHTPGYRHSDEESFEDLVTRTKAALNYLASRPEENILVVTHGYFLRMIVAYVTLGEKLSTKEMERFADVFHMENTGLSIIGHNEKKDNPWWLWVWNDHAHLG